PGGRAERADGRRCVLRGGRAGEELLERLGRGLFRRGVGQRLREGGCPAMSGGQDLFGRRDPAALLGRVRHGGQVLDGQRGDRRRARLGRGRVVLDLDRQLVLGRAEQATEAARADLFGRDDLRVRPVLV